MTVTNLDALRARDDLLAVAASWPALRARLRPSGGTSEIRTPPESRPPLAVAVSDTMRQVEDRTRFYARVLLEETNDWAPSTSTMPVLLQEVATRFGHFTHRSGDRMAVDFLDDAHEMRRLVTGTLASNEPAKWQGPCPEAECVGELYLSAGTTDAKCRDCQRIVGPVEWRRIMEAAFEDRLFTLSELASALVVTDHKIPIETLRTWVKRGAKHGDPNRGLVPVYVEPTLYKFADAYALAERRAERRSA
jgi:hypothetical protein